MIDTLVLFSSMLSKTFGKLVQITISDTETYLVVENPIDDSLAEGDPLSGNEKFFVESSELADLPFVVNYKSLSADLHKLRTSTFFFKDEEGKIQYLMSLSIKVDEFLYLRNIVELFLNGARDPHSPETNRIDSLPKLDLNVSDLVDAVVSEGQKRYNTTVERMKMLEKQSLLREMASRGVFLIKGAVSEVAKKLMYSEASVYKFLQKMERDNEESKR